MARLLGFASRGSGLHLDASGQFLRIPCSVHSPQRERVQKMISPIPGILWFKASSIVTTTVNPLKNCHINFWPWEAVN